MFSSDRNNLDYDPVAIPFPNGDWLILFARTNDVEIGFTITRDFVTYLPVNNIDRPRAPAMAGVMYTPFGVDGGPLSYL